MDENKKNIEIWKNTFEYLSNHKDIKSKEPYQILKGFSHPDVMGPLSSSVEGLIQSFIAEKPIFIGKTEKIKEDLSIYLTKSENIKNAKINQSLIEIGGFSYEPLSKINSNMGDIILYSKIIPIKNNPYDNILRLYPPQIAIKIDECISSEIDKQNECCIYPKYDTSLGGHLLVQEELIKPSLGEKQTIYERGQKQIGLDMNYGTNGNAIYYIIHEGQSVEEGNIEDLEKILDKAKTIADFMQDKEKYQEKQTQFTIKKLNEIAQRYKENSKSMDKMWKETRDIIRTNKKLEKMYHSKIHKMCYPETKNEI